MIVINTLAEIPENPEAGLVVSHKKISSTILYLLFLEAGFDAEVVEAPIGSELYEKYGYNTSYIASVAPVSEE